MSEMVTRGFHSVALVISDRERAFEFYREALGFTHLGSGTEAE